MPCIHPRGTEVTANLYGVSQMKKWLLCLPMLGLLVVLTAGCGTETDMETSNVNADVENASMAVCGKCGNEAVEGCCSEGTDCSACAFKEGSALCCTGVEQMEGEYCLKCGQAAGSEVCCAEDAEECSLCGMSKGAPLCCKVKKSDDAE